MRNIILLLFFVTMSSHSIAQNKSSEILAKYSGNWFGSINFRKFSIKIHSDSFIMKINNSDEIKYHLYIKKGNVWFKLDKYGKIGLSLRDDGKTLIFRYYSFNEDVPVGVPEFTLTKYKRIVPKGSYPAKRCLK